MSDKHTPGPWQACCLNDRPHYVFAGDTDIAICQMLVNDPASGNHEPYEGDVTIEQCRANAQLIQSSPCLLDGVRKAVKALNHIPRHSLPEGDSYELASLLEALIAKATSPP